MSERSIFLAALEITGPTARSAFLDEACGPDTTLRQQLDELIRSHESLGSFLEPATIGGAAANTSCEAEAGGRIGPYRLLRPLGEGGMGTVWLAEQTEPVRRQVALKLIKSGLNSRQVLVRFEAERQALALMDHPNIARVFDAGTTDTGNPYFVMELVQGVPITKYCDEQRLRPRQRLELFVPVCQAVQHAHQKGIIHRDLKPSNVLITLYDGTPVPKVIDFGIAKATGQQLTEQSACTEYGSIVGTLEYMSPEQAEANPLDIDTRSDVYSLGVLLYELLTGTTPLERKLFKETPLLRVLRHIREEEPPRPSARLGATGELSSIAARRGLEPKQLSNQVRGELDWIVMKALDKDRSRRYEAPNALAADIQRHLADEPVTACPPSAAYRFRKFARRHKWGLAMVVALVLVISTVAGSVGWVLSARAAQQAYAEAEAEGALDEAGEWCQAGQWPQAQTKFSRAKTVLGNWGSPALRARLARVGNDVEMGTKLEEIRVRIPANQAQSGVHFDTRKTSADFADAFKEYGLPVLELPEEEAAHRIRSSAIRQALLMALDTWAGLQLDQSPDRDRLLAVAQAAEYDAWRQQYRAALQRWDQAELRRLAGRPEVLEQEPATIDVLSMALGRADPEAAVALLRRGQEKYPADLWLNLNLGYWLVHLEPPRAEEALAFYRAVVALRPHSAGVYINLGAALAKIDRLDEAIVAFERAVRLGPDMSLAHHNLGAAWAKKEEPERAIPAFREAIRLWPTLADAHTGLGNALKDTGQLDDAIAEFRKAVQIRHNFAHAHASLGNALSETGRLDEALAEQQKAIALESTAALYHSNLAAVLLKKGEVEAALDALQIAFCLDAHLPEAHVNYGEALHMKRQLDEAIAAFEEAIRLQPRNYKAYTNLGIALYDKGQLKEALAAQEKAIQYRPTAALPHSNRGNILYVLGRLDEAIAAYETALRLQPNLPHAHHGLGGALTGKGRVKEALAAFARAIQYEPDAPHAYFATAELLQVQGKFNEALDFQRRGHVLIQDKKWAADVAQIVRSHNTLGILLARLGKQAEAEKEIRTALALGKKQAEAAPAIPVHRQYLALSHTSLGWLLMSNPRRRGEAERELRAALALRKELAEQVRADPAYREELAKGHNNLGHYLGESGRRGEAEAEFRAALAVRKQLAEEFSKALKHQVALGETFASLGRATLDRPREALSWYDQAIALLSAILKQQPNLGTAQGFLEESYRGRATALEQLERFEEAARDWARALELMTPGKAQLEVRCRLMTCRISSGQFELGLKDADQLARTDSPDVLYDCACMYAVVHAKTRDDKQAVRAVELLRRAIARGYREVANLKEDSDLDSLRGRDDYKKFLAELEKQK